MLPHPPSSLYFDRVTRQQMGATAIVAVAAMGIVWYKLTRKKPTAEEIELQRRTLLAETGRITDGSIVGLDERTEETSTDGMVDIPPLAEREPPQVLFYRYRSAGVTYECAQDVSQLTEQVRNVRIDLPVQVRYDPNNPADSILVAEEWSGLQQETISTPGAGSVRPVDGIVGPQPD